MLDQEINRSNKVIPSSPPSLPKATSPVDSEEAKKRAAANKAQLDRENRERSMLIKQVGRLTGKSSYQLQGVTTQDLKKKLNDAYARQQQIK
jgi:hypothetical protein